MQEDGKLQVEHLEADSIKPEVKPWGAFVTLGLGVAIFLVYSIVQAIVHGIVSLFTFQANPIDNFEAFIRSLTTNGLAISLSTVVAVPVGIFLIIACIKLRKGIKVSNYLGLVPLRLKTLLMLLLVPLGLMLILVLLSYFVIQPENAGFMVDAYANSVWPALFWIALVIFAPVFEEALFRGFAITGLRQSRLGTTGAVILTSLIWAVLHLQYDWFGMATIMVIGIVLGIVRIKTGSLWGTILIHAVWNLLQMIALTTLP
jgi:membrane protease YdiL (CAAX protease family)